MKIIEKMTLGQILISALFSFSLYATDISLSDSGSGKEANDHKNMHIITSTTTRYNHTFDYTLEKIIISKEITNSEYTAKINQVLSKRYHNFFNHDVMKVYKKFLKEDQEFIANYSYIYKTYLYFIDTNMITFLEESYVYTGGANGMLYIKPLMFSLKNGKEISSKTSTLIKNTKDHVLIDILRKKLLEVRDKNIYFDFDNITLPSSFYISDKGIGFSYGLYEIAPRVGGIINIMFTYDELRPFIKNNSYISKLNKQNSML
jgi:hypothetical protein